MSQLLPFIVIGVAPNELVRLTLVALPEPCNTTSFADVVIGEPRMYEPAARMIFSSEANELVRTE